MGRRLRRRPARRRRPPARCASRGRASLHAARRSRRCAARRRGRDVRPRARASGAARTAASPTTCSTRPPAGPAFTGLVAVTALAPTTVRGRGARQGGAAARPDARASRLASHGGLIVGAEGGGGVGRSARAGRALPPSGRVDTREGGAHDRPDPLDYGWWLASRSAGIVAISRVSVSVLVGLLMANSLPRRPRRQEATARGPRVRGAGRPRRDRRPRPDRCSATPGSSPAYGHRGAFTMSYRPGFTGLGILAGWASPTLGLSFYVRRRIGSKPVAPAAPRDDRVWALGVVHVLGAGTDAGQWCRCRRSSPSPRLPILYLFVLRVLPQSLDGKRQAAARRRGRRAPAGGAQGRASSSCAASRRSVTSSPARPQSWTASGRPSSPTCAAPTPRADR